MDPTRRALELAAAVRGTTHPNPAVGAIVVDETGVIVGEGATSPPGGPHAEIHALRAAGDRAAGATLVTTLEPCCHHGRTGPCTAAIAAAGIRRVVFGALDPDPLVGGGGAAELRARGIDVEGPVAQDAVEQTDPAYFHNRRTGHTYVTLKAAMTLDGRIAGPDGSATWITGDAAREDAHRERALADAVLVGVETIIADDSRLTVRLPGYAGSQPVRVVLDGRARTPRTAAVLAADGSSLVYVSAAAPASRRDALSRAGAEVAEMPDGGDGRLDLNAVVADLGARGMVATLVEGGAAVLGAFARAGLYQRLVLYVAPVLFAGDDGVPAFRGQGAGSLAEATRFGAPRATALGDDLKLELFPSKP